MTKDDVIDKNPKRKPSVNADTGTGNGTVTKTKKSSKHKGPKLTGVEKCLSKSSSLKRTSVTASSERKQLLSRERCKISVIDRDKTHEAKAVETTPKTYKHSKTSRLSRQQSLTNNKWHASNQLSRDANFIENDSDFDENSDEMNKSIRYSRRMPLFPPVSSSHAQARSEIIRQSKTSQSSQAGETSGNRTSVVGHQATAVRKSVVINPLKLSVVSLKLPTIS